MYVHILNNKFNLQYRYMNKTVKTIDGEVVVVNENWKDVDGLPFNEKWTDCPTLIDENEHLWVDESVLD